MVQRSIHLLRAEPNLNLRVVPVERVKTLTLGVALDNIMVQGYVRNNSTSVIGRLVKSASFHLAYFITAFRLFQGLIYI